MNCEGVWASFYRWRWSRGYSGTMLVIRVTFIMAPWIKLSLNHLRINTWDHLRCMAACWKALKASRPTWKVYRPRGGVGWPPLCPMDPSPLVGWVLAWCRVGMCWSCHVGTSVCIFVGPWIHVSWSSNLEKKHKCDPRVESDFGCFVMDPSDFARWWAP